MEVFAKYFRRLIVGNAPQIFPGINKPVENPGNYPLLVAELRKLSQDADQARKIAESIDSSDGDIFKDFDLSTFMDHFKLDPVEKIILSLAFKATSKPDLRTKADAILSNNLRRFVEVIASPANDTERSADIPVPIVARLVDGLLQYPPPNLNDDGKVRVVNAIRLRYQASNSGIPAEVSTATQLMDILGPRQSLVWALQRAGPHSTSSIQACKETLQSVGNVQLQDDLVASALLYMLVTQNWRQYSPAVFVATIRENNQAQKIDWQNVVHHFDREGLRIDQDRFLLLFDALLPVALDNSNFDLQLLWGGKWRNPDTQLSFVTAFCSLPPDRIDIATIPRLRFAFAAADFADASTEVRDYAARAIAHPMASLDATTALFHLALHSPDFLMTPAGQQLFQDVVQNNVDVFLCAAMKIPKPWTDTQQEIMTRLFFPFLLKQHRSFDFVLHCVWKQDKQWVATRLVETHAQDPMKLPLLLDHADAHKWLDDLLMIINGFGVDLAALAHRQGLINLEQWAQANVQRGPRKFAFALSRFLTIKAEDELKTARKEQSTQRTINLAVKTVHAILEMLEDLESEDRRDQLVSLSRMCIQAYPRLINYGEGFDDIIDANGSESNAIPENVDAMMHEHYKNMYSGERDVRDIVEALQSYKESRDPVQQDLFACMIHGLFDEYSCYHEYPLEALATTAVLFGGVINFNLVSGITCRVGLDMVLEAVRDHGPDTSMYKFGLQAILHFFSRLPEWPGFCSLLLEVPGLQGTEAYSKAEEVVQKRVELTGQEGATDGATAPNTLPDGAALTNGDIVNSVASGSALPPFSSIHVDPPTRTEMYQDPPEEVQDTVLFALNNVSEQNIESKIHDLRDVIQHKYHRWFAGYLVEERAKMQPNFHKLYLEMLNMFSDMFLWDEVLRETYVSVIKLLNAQSTLESSTERSHLKNLGGWLGSLTIARDKPIKFKNISFSDLLIEAYDTQRLIIAIPFTCKVLAQASKSIVFKPPNPWLMEIIGLLIELYHFAELRLQLKFEIEVLCKDLNLDHRTVEPSTGLRERPHNEDGLSGPTLPDGLEGFDDLTLTLGRPSARSERFSPSAITASLPDIGSLLVYPPTSNTSINRESLRYVLENAVRKAIQEIIAPVVERSVTIAAISTAQLIHKDFATEPNEDRVRQSALNMVKTLAGSLALVTCKEPLRMSMTNNIRVLSAEIGDQALPEGAILMCVNDNLDTACSLVESAAEQRSMPEIEDNIEQQLLARRRHRATRSNEPFVDPIINRWAFYIPEPYKQSPNGLNKEQMAIYEEFARQSRGAPAHGKASSTDSGRHIVNEVLQDHFPPVPNLPTPADLPAIPYQAPQQVQRLQLPPSIPSQIVQTPQLNGFAQPKTNGEQIQEYVFELQRAAREAPESHLTDLSLGSAVLEAHQQILRLVAMSPPRDEAAMATAKRVFQILYTQTEKPLEIEVLVHLVRELCELSAITSREVALSLLKQDDERLFNVQITAALLEARLLDLHRLDLIISKAIQYQRIAALDFLADLMDKVLFCERPVALTADFANSLESLGHWLAQDSNLPLGQSIVRKLRENGVPDIGIPVPDQQSILRHDQVEYTFTEWTGLCSRTDSTEKTLAAFISQVHQRQLLHTEEDSCIFFRICIDIAVDAFEEAETDAAVHLGAAYIHIDALAKFVILLTKFQEEGTEGEVKTNRSAYLESVLSMIILVLNHHHVMRGEKFNQRVFFRFFSTLICEYQSTQRQFHAIEADIMRVFGRAFLSLQPTLFPAFAFGWFSLISHRFFMPGMLLLPDQAGWELYADIMETMLSYVGQLLRLYVISKTTKDIYRGVLRVLLVLHHDFPEFLADNHYRLCRAIPAHCTQLRNLILSAYPSSFPELPDPFTAGLKVDRISEIRIPPTIAGEYERPLIDADIKHAVDMALEGGTVDGQISEIAQAITVHGPEKENSITSAQTNVNVSLVDSLVLYVAIHALRSVGLKGGPTFVQNSPEASFLLKLAHTLRPEGRYYFLGAMANQLRYPNNHTHYFSYALLYLFGSDQNDQQDSELRQQITRVLLERLVVHRPHPWGLIITLLELLKNPSYGFWELPFIKGAPEIEGLFASLFQGMGQPSR